MHTGRYRMPRKPRFNLPGVPQHIIQRGNNHQVCFGSEEDMKAYLGWLKEFSKKYSVYCAKINLII